MLQAEHITVRYGDFSAAFTCDVHVGREGKVLNPATYPESNHNYGNSLDETQTLTYPGAASLTLVFSDETRTESGYDHIYVYDYFDNLIAQYMVLTRFTGKRADPI